jgi:hypothetical protein
LWERYSVGDETSVKEREIRMHEKSNVAEEKGSREAKVRRWKLDRMARV